MNKSRIQKLITSYKERYPSNYFKLEQKKKEIKAVFLWLLIFFYKKDFLKVSFVIYYPIARYWRLVGQNISWTTGWWLARRIWTLLDPDIVADKIIFYFSWSTSCWIWIFLVYIYQMVFIRENRQNFWRWRKLCPIKSLIYF